MAPDSRHSAFFIAARSASLMRSCQPGPPAWKNASTSLSILSETTSRVFGIAGRSTAGAATFFAGLKRASAASVGFVGLRGVVAIIEPGVIGSIKKCDGQWCEMTFDGHTGWMAQSQVWGAYPGEKVKN